MRDLQNQLESIARKGPGWGWPVKVADGSYIRVSYRAALEQVARERAPQPRPRADKGSRYATDKNGVRYVVTD